VVNPPDHCGLRDLRELVHEIDTLIASARSQSRTLAVLLARRSESPESAEAPAAHPAPAAQRTPRHPDLPLLLAARLGLACHADEVPGTGAPDEMVMLTGLLPVGRPVEAHLYQRAMALRDTLQGPAWMGGSTVVPQVDLGIAVYPLDGYTGATLLQAARLAAGGAARQGGVAFHDPLANLAAQRQWQLGLALQQAIGKGELRLLYQPKLSLHSGAIEGVEALLRWRTADFGEVPAAEFIPLAERHGCMQAISDWTLHQACQQARAWQQAGLPRVRIGVNVSQMQLRLGDLAQQVQAALLRTGADPAALGIEITEDSLMADIDKATRALRELKALGVEISLDDFGTGSSSLGALQRLPLDVVNVDRSFIHDVTASPESVSMTRAIITMAHGMQLRVVAEGVETEGQVGVLAARGCDLVQGHWFSPAVAPEQIEALLREDRRLPPHLLRQRQRQRTLLLVDDEANILAALKRLLRRDGYQIITADGGEQGLQRLAEHPVDVIVSDQRMPGMSGVEFLRRAKALRPDTVRMTLSGFTELQSIIDAVNEGAIYKFLTKLWDDALLRQHIACRCLPRQGTGRRQPAPLAGAGPCQCRTGSLERAPGFGPASPARTIRSAGRQRFRRARGAGRVARGRAGHRPRRCGGLRQPRRIRTAAAGAGCGGQRGRRDLPAAAGLRSAREPRTGGSADRWPALPRDESGDGRHDRQYTRPRLPGDAGARPLH
jgi:EAL domain-containing protein (putative c-di-GMP-specific phosphodiesterase class I)/CheY-like chemotaxis protein